MCGVTRDIKPENVLFTPDGTLKLADFGLAIDTNQERAVTRAGTLDYMAPEVLRCPLKHHPEENKGNRSLQCSVTMDSWATGVLVYELLVGFPPFASDDVRDCMNKIMSCAVVYPKRMSSGARAFVEAALSAHPGDRPTAMEMLGDPWIVGGWWLCRRRTGPEAGQGQVAAWVSELNVIVLMTPVLQSCCAPEHALQVVLCGDHAAVSALPTAHSDMSPFESRHTSGVSGVHASELTQCATVTSCPQVACSWDLDKLGRALGMPGDRREEGHSTQPAGSTDLAPADALPVAHHTHASHRAQACICQLECRPAQPESELEPALLC